MALTTEQIKVEIDRREKEFTEYLHSEDYQEKLRKRLQIQDAGDRNPKARAYIWHLCARPDNPAEGAKFFIENFGWINSPKTKIKHLPLILFPFQEKEIEWAIEHINDGKDAFIEKSREMGVSWLVFAYIPLWYWLFVDGSNFLLGSYKEKLVDDYTVDSLFGKIDYALEGLPKWMMPKNFNPNKHRTKLKLHNPATNNYITGDTMNPQFGRGARKTAILFDELGFWDYAKDAWESCGDTTNSRIANSTPNGYNYYAMLRDTDIEKLTLHWSQHPLKTQQWYEYECARRTEEEVAQELDISYSKSLEGRVYPEWNESNITEGRFEYDEDLPLYVGWDFGRTDDTAIIWCQPDSEGKLRIIDTYRNNGKTIHFYIPLITGIMTGDPVYSYTKYDLELIDKHKNWRAATHFGDPAGRFTTQISDETVFSILQNFGIVVNFKDSWKSFEKRRSASKLLMQDGILLNWNERTKHFNICMLNAAYPKVKTGGIEEVRSMKPKHDSTSHYRSAFEYLALGLSEMIQRRTKPIDKFPPKERRSSGRGTGRRRLMGY